MTSSPISTIRVGGQPSPIDGDSDIFDIAQFVKDHKLVVGTVTATSVVTFGGITLAAYVSHRRNRGGRGAPQDWDTYPSGGNLLLGTDNLTAQQPVSGPEA